MCLCFIVVNYKLVCIDRMNIFYSQWDEQPNFSIVISCQFLKLICFVGGVNGEGNHLRK